jgi:hypothetical protein
MFVILLITIPAVYYFDNKQVSENELVKIDNLTLSRQPDYSRGKNPRINIYLTNTERILVVNLEELHCVNKDEILSDFKEGDIVSIKVFTDDTTEFYETGIISRFQKIYGLEKNGKEYIQLSCRNSDSARRTNSVIYASSAAAFLSFVLALFFYKPSSKESGWLAKIDPLLIVGLFWFIVMIIFR